MYFYPLPSNKFKEANILWTGTVKYKNEDTTETNFY